MRSRGAKPPQGAWRAVGRDDDAVTADAEHGRTREMLAGSVRFVPRPVTKGGAGALFLVTWHAPGRFRILSGSPPMPGSRCCMIRPRGGPAHRDAGGSSIETQRSRTRSSGARYFRFPGTVSSISAGEAEPPSLAVPLADAAKRPSPGTGEGL